jgi:hypothetical protein
MAWNFVGVCLFFGKGDTHPNGGKAGYHTVNQVIGGEIHAHL